jgi:leucyl-tRNA synthetase
MATECTDYDFRKIEPTWQSFWEEKQCFRAVNDSPAAKYYVLDMFPYPSGAGLHVGHHINYTPTDILARYHRARGRNVLHPMGWDAFGLPAEQHAVKTGTAPAANTRANVANFKQQIKSFGYSYDWDREINTTDPRYFRWTQWIFLQLFQRGLAYVDERPVWWCPELRTVLANEEVIDGKSEVGSFPVERRNLRQWVLRITAYAERLLADLSGVDWPESTKRMQEAWIGRSEGAEIVFQLEPESAGDLKVFTTRPDTLFGCTYLVLAPEHPLADVLTAPGQQAALAAYRRAAAAKSDLERTDLAKEKSGVFTGAYAVNPINGARVPIWVADYVLMGYGTGAIMAVPAHDERDYEFATRFELPVIPVIAPGEASPETPLPYTGEGSLVHSGSYTGLDAPEAKRRITADLTARGAARATVHYNLRDWLFSRQRYWGEPFPIAWVDEADYRRAQAARPADFPAEPVTFVQDGVARYALPLPAAGLPLELPIVESYLPSGTGESPLARAADWVDIWLDPVTGASAPAAGPRPAGSAWVRARRETNTMPQWAGSCWYYLRFTDPHNDRALAAPAALRYWRGPDIYVGGAEHAVLHLLYARFWHKVLFDLGVVPENEPFRKLFHQGIILGEDGEKMSKSRGNVVNPDTIIASHGADTLRLYLMFLGPLEAMKPWNPQGIEGVHRFLQKVWRESLGRDGAPHPKLTDGPGEPPELTRVVHATIKKVGEDIEALRFNTAISQMMICVNAMQKAPAISRGSLRAFLQLLAPFAPHVAEELWARVGGEGGSSPIHRTPWPPYDAALLETRTAKLVFQVNGKHRGDADVPVGLSEAAALELAQTHPKVAPHLAGKTVKKVIYVPGRILNLVVEG